MTPSIGANQRLISDYEFDFAKRLAREVLEKPKISVWLVLIPILFLYYAHKIQQYKAGLQGFCDGVLHTRKIALEAVVAELLGSDGPDYRASFLAAHPEPTPQALKVLERQTAQIELLKEHYRRLLLAAAPDYRGLLRGAYRNSGEYGDFLDRLNRAEEEVGQAVLEAFQPGEEARRINGRMVRLSRELRAEEQRRFF
ncbi:NF038143 family protein [Desulfurivibrio sp. D14AmB]|uniref:NF038143 family protein n=1 Tax=Desulfurivibrio sp. D14AmB TaxID=3374370 RepID=UPI00376F15FD